jgi:hypothetical protein
MDKKTHQFVGGSFDHTDGDFLSVKQIRFTASRKLLKQDVFRCVTYGLGQTVDGQCRGFRIGE